MSDQPLTDLLVWGVYQPFIKLLMTGLPIAFVLLFVTILILIFFCCQEATRAGRNNDRADVRSPVKETLNFERPTSNMDVNLTQVASLQRQLTAFWQGSARHEAIGRNLAGRPGRQTGKMPTCRDFLKPVEW